jgi:tRNA pseudouridine65 synthase
MRSLPVLYQDEQLVAVNKPSGLLVHRSAIDRHETGIAMKIVRDQLGQWVYPIHRLDKATSGALVFALDRDTARAMTCAFTEARVSKAYLAIVRGFTGEGDRIDHPLKDRRETMTGGEKNGDRPGKRSVTEYRRLATVELPQAVGRYSTARYSLVAAAPLTGRTHQIRRHMKHIFHPVVGDTTYGDGKQNEFFRRKFNCHRLMLHAHTIEFIHPWTGRRLSIRAPLDHDFRAVLEALQWDKVALDIHLATMP